MVFQSAPDCAEAVIKCTAAGVPVNNVMNFWHPGGYLQSDIDALAAAVDGAIDPNYVGIMNTDTTYDSTLVRGLTNAIDLSAAANASAGPGLFGTHPLPNNVTLCVSLRSGFTGRSARGRFYTIGMDDGFLQTTNTVTAAYRTGAISLVQAIITAAAAVGWHAVVLSRFAGGARRVVATHLDITSVITVNDDTDSQRGRLPQGH